MLTNPITGIDYCCARAQSGKIANAPPINFMTRAAASAAAKSASTALQSYHVRYDGMSDKWPQPDSRAVQSGITRLPAGQDGVGLNGA